MSMKTFQASGDVSAGRRLTLAVYNACVLADAFWPASSKELRAKDYRLSLLRARRANRVRAANAAPVKTILAGSGVRASFDSRR